MATQGPTTTVTAMAGATPAGMTSRLAQMQMRFQQRQQQERDQRKVEMISTTKATAASVAAQHHTAGSNGSSNTVRTSTISAYSTTTTSSTTSTGTAGAGGDLSASLGAGKVRQMFDERRHHRVAGIDKSYPLQPIQQQQQQLQPAGKPTVNGSNVSNGNPTKGTAAGLNNKTRVPPISANTKARLAMQQQRPQQQENGNHVETLKAASFDDNENLLDDEKFPDTISFDEDITLTPTPIPRKLPNVGKLNGHHQNVNSLKLKPVPGRTPTTTPTVTAKASSSATKSVPKKSPAMASSSAPAPAQSSSSPSSANSSKSSASRTSTGKPLARPSRKPSTASSVVSTTSAASNRSLKEEPVPDGLERCTICGRNFAEDRIGKHREICQKTKNKKRKVFDTTKHRVLGTEAEKYVLSKKKVGAGASKKSISGMSTTTKATGATADSRRKSDWRRKHEEFIQAIRAAKEMQAHLAKGGKLSDLPPPPPSENPDYIQCPHCSRRFNQTAAERHIPKCATMLHNKPKPTAKAKRF
ncbi:zinc finger C2HC domain-containing protein 1C-like isoform X2 [Armigeres subalbatus]|uniref:zinc finger C2HC domain-containing protein 1C-like isoform X2 n=1 Tax=Armigeres subalbatus TaxID=124917 RepID=UPI002ED530F3